ncbi:hypothetical protein F0231_12515 [Vibrio sp. RE86]|uniref:hypothetical protein n=1 Tax=Vibrio sp. RE86 TaxID=2607605 RepID=UPI001493AB49|nr:hypothetical protein [Vibrio sp. RE86]NOH80565.1 hypothetical protein [Vibrio sp. RE86]
MKKAVALLLLTLPLTGCFSLHVSDDMKWYHVFGMANEMEAEYLENYADQDLFLEKNKQQSEEQSIAKL